jgi:predicted DNA-binding mobile mystery protein A
MKKTKRAAQSRSYLDKRLQPLRPVSKFVPPVRGWVKAIRESLGMSTVQLAKRLRVKQPSVTAVEQSELKGTIELSTLRRVAAALDCTVIYALIPNKPLEEVIRGRARAFYKSRLAPIRHSMTLENQRVPKGESKAILDEIIRETNPRLFWD